MHESGGSLIFPAYYKKIYSSVPGYLVPFTKFYQSSLWLSESDNPAVVIQHADHRGKHNSILGVHKNVACVCVNAQILSTYCFLFFFFPYYSLKSEISQSMGSQWDSGIYHKAHLFFFL